METTAETSSTGLDNRVAVTIIKRKKALLNQLASRQEQKKALKKKLKLQKKAKKNTKLFVKSMESIIKDYRLKEADHFRLRRESKKLNATRYCEPDVKERLIFVIRVRGPKTVSPKTAKILKLLRLPKQFSGSFLKLTPAALTMLKLVEPFVIWGTPSTKNTRDIIFKRSVVNTKDNSRIGLTDNRIVEEHLGKYGMVCIEDIVNEITTLGRHFKEANNFLWNFTLSNPSRGPLGAKEYQLPHGEGDIDGMIQRMV